VIWIDHPYIAFSEVKLNHPIDCGLPGGSKTPPDLVMPNCEVEYLIEPALIAEPKSTTKLTVISYVDGPVPPPFLNASRTGWTMITRNLKEYLG
jgi:hypothetical protein